MELLADLRHRVAVMADPDRQSDGPSDSQAGGADYTRPFSAASRGAESQSNSQAVRQNPSLTRSSSKDNASRRGPRPSDGQTEQLSDSQTEAADSAAPSNDTDGRVGTQPFDDSSEDNRELVGGSRAISSSSERPAVPKGSKLAGPSRAATPVSRAASPAPGTATPVSRAATPVQAATAAADRALAGVRKQRLRSKEPQPHDDSRQSDSGGLSSPHNSILY